MSNDNQIGGKDDASKQSGGSGNFANDPQRATEAGTVGGQHSHDGESGQTDQSGSGRSQQGSVESDDEVDSPQLENSNSASQPQR